MKSVEIAGISLPLLHEDPGWIPETRLILTPTTERNLRKVLHPLAHGYNVLLVGDAGVGKNALIYYINQVRRHPTIRYSFNEDTLPEDLVGAYRIDPVTHTFIWSDGPLAHAMRSGATFVADEMNLSPPEVLKRFYSVFTDRELQLLEGDSSVIPAAPGFNFVATQNPAEGFEGRKNLPREIQKYFATVYVDAYPHAELAHILSGLHPGLPKDVVASIVHMNAAIERLVIERNIAGRDLVRYHFNIRNLTRLARRLEDKTGIPGLEVADIYLRPFRSIEDRQAIEGVIQNAVDGESRAAELLALPASLIESDVDREVPLHVDSRAGRIDLGRACLAPGTDGNEVVFRERINQTLADYPPVASTRITLEAIARSVQLGENILLESEADVEPEEIVHFFAGVMGKRLSVITLSRGMHTGDVLGGLKPRAHARAAEDRDAVEWVDGPLTTAVRRGDYILLKGLEAAGPELVEKLNMLLDDARALLLPPESGETDPVRLQKDARIFGVKFFRLQRSTPSVSRAFRNRFSAFVVPAVVDNESLGEYVEHALGVSDSDNLADVIGPLVNFHLFIRERSQRREIGSGNLQPYQFGLTNLRRFCEHIPLGLQGLSGDAANRENLPEDVRRLVLEAGGIAYIHEISDARERERVEQTLLNLLAGVPLERLLAEYEIHSKKKLIQTSSVKKRIWWDQEQHWREAHTGVFKRKLEGQALKKGVNINTPETGGKTKEGQDAWYGSDTQGNKGQGEPGAGGGSWGYRTEELYREFLKKRRALWEYNIGVTLEDFKETFAAEIERVRIDFDRLLDPQVDITRRYMPRGSRVDARRFLAYLSGRGDGRVFDRTTVTVEDDRLKGVEILFAVNKGRRIFNFEYSIATLVAIMSCAIILESHELPFGVAGYSDLSNMKQNIDVIWMKNVLDHFDARREEDLFYGLARDWHGDTVAEFQILDELAGAFSADARTRIMVVVSDFRGSRGKVTFEKDLNSEETARLRQSADDISKRGIVLLGVGVGARAISDYVFPESLQVGGENFANLPALLAGRVTELVHRHHNAAVL